MNRAFWKQVGCLGSMAAMIAGCAQPATEQAFTVRRIDSLPGRKDGTVRIKLTTPGDYAEADEHLVVRFAQVIAVREATAEQRRVATTRARTSFHKIAAQPRRARYLAVKTERSAAPGTAAASPARPEGNARRSSAAGVAAAASVMIWDTQTQEIVGNKVYDLGREPSSGSVTRFETYTAEYVGSGL